MDLGWVKDINWVTTAKVAGGLLPVLVSVATLLRGLDRLRARLRNDVEVLEKLPPESPARAQMIELVNRQAERLWKLELHSSRDWTGFIGGLILGPFAFWGAIELATSGPWLGLWGTGIRWLGTAALGVTGLACLYGIIESPQRLPRDAKGNSLNR